jgi:hypothetical protein
MNAVLSRLESELDRLGARGGGGGGEAAASAAAATTLGHHASAYAPSASGARGGGGGVTAAYISSLRGAGAGDAGAALPERQRDEAHRTAEDVQAMLNDLSDTLAQLIAKTNDEYAREQSNPVRRAGGACARDRARSSFYG